MVAYNVNEFIKVTVAAARVTGSDANNVTVDMNGTSVTLPQVWDQISITRVDPPDWPPQYGDTWNDSTNRPWHAVTDKDAMGNVVIGLAMFSDPKTIVKPAKVKTDNGPLRLMYRATPPVTP